MPRVTTSGFMRSSFGSQLLVFSHLVSFFTEEQPIPDPFCLTRQTSLERPGLIFLQFVSCALSAHWECTLFSLVVRFSLPVSHLTQVGLSMRRVSPIRSMSTCFPLDRVLEGSILKSPNVTLPAGSATSFMTVLVMFMFRWVWVMRLGCMLISLMLIYKQMRHINNCSFSIMARELLIPESFSVPSPHLKWAAGYLRRKSLPRAIQEETSSLHFFLQILSGDLGGENVGSPPG